jgi:Planctomycete cytochrome C
VGWCLAGALVWVCSCSSTHSVDPPPDPELVAAARAERERVAAEREQDAAERGELERAVLAIEAEPEQPARLLSEDEVYQVLAYHCVDCHYRPEVADAVDGFWDLDSFDRMIDTAKVVPGDGEGSRIVQRMRDGSMPPVTSGAPPVPATTIDRIADFIASLD